MELGQEFTLTVSKKVNAWQKYQPMKHKLNNTKIQKPNKETVHITNRRNGLNAKTPRWSYNYFKYIVKRTLCWIMLK